jgi:hypothetical protein
MTIRTKAEEGKAALQQQAMRASEAARRVKTKAVDGVDSFPVVALAGGLAVGVLIGALLPRTRQEEELLGTLGGAINDRAKDAVFAARDAGQAKLVELGISQAAAGKQVGKLIESIAQVAESAGNAAVESVRH